VKDSSASIAVDGGGLSLREGLLAIIRPALQLLEPGGILAVNTTNNRVGEELKVWCDRWHHKYFEDPAPDDSPNHTRHLISRGRLAVPIGERESTVSLPRQDGAISAESVLATIPMPESADPISGFAPRGALYEPGGPVYPFTLVQKCHAAPPEVARLYDQAVASQWSARDLAWEKLPKLLPEIERAIAQVFTFLAENELSALYLPSKFVSRIHPAYVETAMFLSMQMADEARHLDVFLKRARAGGEGLGVSSATTSWSLHSLLELENFAEAAFILSVLGEGTFVDLLTFIEHHAPDEVTAEIVRRARNDEARHVHFGIAHVRHAIENDETTYRRLELAVRKRAATLSSADEAPAPLQDGLTVLAAGGTAPRAIARGHESYYDLLQTMSTNRVKRLRSAGLTLEQAQVLSDLHTPNFM